MFKFGETTEQKKSEMKELHLGKLKRYFYVKSLKESVEKELESVKWARKPESPYFDKILCSCGAVLEFPHDTLYSRIICDCGNEIEFYTRHWTSADDADLFSTFISAKKTIYISDYATEELHLEPAKNIVVLKGAYKRHVDYKKRCELEEKLDYYSEELRKMMDEIYRIIEEQEFAIIISDLYSKTVIKCTRDDLKKLFLLSSDRPIWKDNRRFIEESLKEFLWDYFEYKGYKITWSCPELDFSKYSKPSS
ncbi:MAG: hypothetical protein QXT67_04920 [Candidatus Bathyarchaeia archaeon]